MTDDRVVYHRRKGAAKYIEEKYNQSVSASKLAKLAVYGGGPPYRNINGDTIYEESDLDLWAEDRMGPKIRSTSELEHRPGWEKPKGRPPKTASRQTSVDAA
jgi:hypothetical protein